jgi:hypothetical protein
MAIAACDLCQQPTDPDQLITLSGKQICATCKPDAVMNLKSGVGVSPRVSPEKAEGIRRRIRTLNLISFAFGVPGILLAGSGQVVKPSSPGMTGMMVAIWASGMLLFTVGMVFYARMKGRHGAMGLFGLLSCMGLLILHFLPKVCQNCRASASYRAKECRDCGAPV